MSGINGFKGGEIPTLPVFKAPEATDAPESAPDIKSYDINLPGPAPDLDHLPPDELFDALSEIVKEYGSEEAKADLEAGKSLAITLKSPDGQSVDYFMDGATGLAFATSNNETIGSGGTTQSPPMHNIGGIGIDLDDLFNQGRELPPSLLKILQSLRKE